MTNVGAEGDHWSSSTYSSTSNNAGNLNFNASNVNPLNGTNRANGLSVRCVQHLCGPAAFAMTVERSNGSFAPGVAEATASVSEVGRFSNPLSC